MLVGSFDLAHFGDGIRCDTLILLHRDHPPQAHEGDDHECGDRAESAEPRRQRIDDQAGYIADVEFDLLPFLTQDERIHYMKGYARERHIGEIDGERRPRRRVFAHPSGRERNERYNEKPHDIHPKDLKIDPLGQAEHDVMVHPIDRDEEKAQDVGQEKGQNAREILDPVPYRQGEFQHHDGDNDRENAVAECLQSVFIHMLPPILSVITC